MFVIYTVAIQIIERQYQLLDTRIVVRNELSNARIKPHLPQAVDVNYP